MPDGQPVAGARITVNAQEASRFGPVLISFTTGTQGHYNTELVHGSYALEIYIHTGSFNGFDVPSVDYLQPVTQDIVMVHWDETAPRPLARSIFSDLSANSATVSWLIDEPATSRVTVDGV